jgi:spermidine synthase
MSDRPAGNSKAVLVFLFIFFFLSGICGLIYQIVWTRMLSLLFGHTTFAVSTVITAFMGGLALGSWYFGRLADSKGALMAILKRKGASPLFLAYGILEGAIGVYCLLTPFLFRIVETIYLQFSETSFLAVSLLRSLLCVSVLVIPTFLMGGTLPLLSKFFIRHSGEVGRKLGSLYFINTIGAALGAFIAGFYLIRLIGIQMSLTSAAIINIMIGLAVYLINRGITASGEPRETDADERREHAGDTVTDTGRARLLFYVFAFTGFASMVYEICWTRALALALGSSTYAFTTMLTTFLFGIALGSILFGCISRRISFGLVSFGWFEVAIGISCLFSIFMLGKAPLFFIILFPYVKHSYNLIITADFILCFLAMLVPTVIMGFVFPLAGKIYAASFQDLGKRIGEIYAINTMGCILGAFATGFILVPFIGIQNSLKIAVTINVLCGALFIYTSKLNMLRKTAAGLIVVPALLCAGYLPSWNPAVMSSGGAVYADWYRGDYGEIQNSAGPVFYKDGITSTVSVYKDAEGTYLKVNGKTDASTGGDMPTQLLLGYIPVLYHRAPEDVFIVGLGSGITAKAVLDFPSVRSVTCAELEPAVVEANRFFAPFNGDVLKSGRFTLKIDDGRNALLASSKQYDVIISEPSNPWIAGIGNLFTKEFYTTSKAKLKKGGIFCQWLQLYDIDPADVKMILKTFFSVFPDGIVWRGCDADLILLGAESGLVFDYQNYLSHYRQNRAFHNALKSINITAPDAIFAHYITDARQIVPLLATAYFNSDNLPVLEFSAPKSFYSATSADNVKGLYRFKTRKVPDVTGYRAEDTMSPAYYLSLYRDLEEAFSQETLDEAVKAYPRDREIGFLKIRYMLDHKQIVRAESELRALVSVGSTDLRVYRQLARIYAEDGLIGKAADMYDRAYRLNPRSEEIIRDYIDVLIKQKNYPKALHIAEKARHEIPNSPVPRIAQGNVFLALKEYGKALPVFLGVTNKDPGNAVGKNLFQVYRGLNDTKNGIVAGEALLKTKEIDAQSVLELARMYTWENDREKAGELLLRALRMDPYNREIARELARTGR